MWERDDLFIAFFWRKQFLFCITFGPAKVCKSANDCLTTDILKVVKADRPDLEEQKAALTRQQNEYKILLKERPKFRQEENVFFFYILCKPDGTLSFRVLRTIFFSDWVPLVMTFSGEAMLACTSRQEYPTPWWCIEHPNNSIQFLGDV